jgi:2TM domain
MRARPQRARESEEEVTAMATQLQPVQPAEPRPEDTELRQEAKAHLDRVRKFKADAAAFAIGIPVLTAIWAITEYQNSGGWPHRLSEQSNPGDWNPWILYVVLIWGFLLTLDAIRTFVRRPTTEAEIQREVEKLKRG